MQAIVTVFVKPSRTMGARIIAKCEAGKTVVPYEHLLSGDENHRAAAKQLCLQLGWANPFVSGYLPNDSYVHVFTE